MRVRVVFNASSGYGKAALLADLFAGQLVADGHEVDRRPAGPGFRETYQGLENDDLLVLVGGDGTVHHALPDAVRTRVPVYHVPTGTENLFARDWGMNTHVQTLRDAIARRHVVEADVGTCDGRPFALMCSVGFDAAIIHARCDAGRRGDGHLAYVIPVLEQLADPVFPVLRVTIDGQVAVDGQRGVAIVANSRQYAMRLDPAIHASNTDGLLDVVFLPCSTALGAASWTFLSRIRRHTGAPGVVYRTGRRVIIETPDGPAPCQIDGEPLGIWNGSGGSGGARVSSMSTLRLVISVTPRALRVLVAAATPRRTRSGSFICRKQPTRATP